MSATEVEDCVESTDAKNSIEAAGPLLKGIMTTLTIMRKLALRHIALPRPAWMATDIVSGASDPATGFAHFSHGGLRPWYVEPTAWSRWSPVAILMQLIGGKPPGDEKYHPQGYTLDTIGPSPQEGKGIEDMKVNIEDMRAKRSLQQRCPFSQRREAV